jgi:hypothetical protein
MEYHSDRFQDYSLLIFKDTELVGILPANRVGDTVYSHQGLTYGGLTLFEDVYFKDVTEIFKAVLLFLKSESINHLQLKLIPSIYTKCPSEEMDYLLFKCEARLVRTDILSVIDASNRLQIKSSNRKRGLKKAQKQSLIVKETEDFLSFWNEVLIPNLEKQHGVQPVHSLEEITLLKNKFPNKIRQFNVYSGDEVVAGVTIFETQKVAHAQYISANENKQQLGSLDLLFHELIENVYQDKSFFDFGISNENQGKQINQGLLNWKESFGGRTIVQRFYSLEVSSVNKLNDMML